MKQKINSLLLIKIVAFILLTWIYCVNKDMNTYNKSINQCYKLGRKLDTRNYRLLAKCKKNKNSNMVWLKEDIPNIVEYEKNDMSNNEKWAKGRKGQSDRSILNKAQYFIEVVDYNNGMFDGKHFHFEKKWIKKKDFDNFIEKNKRIRDIALKKIKFRNYGYGVVIFFLFLLVGIGLPLLQGKGWVIYNGKTALSGFDWVKGIASKLGGAQHYFFLISFSVLIIILAIIIIRVIPKILRNNEKYKRIKYMSDMYE
ncbi:fam-m protein [Plasmodium brasilianum]|uniref:Fam-m protein n=1 Tax=Plasmodium brasilianum TaxID=5824 RepID=A0ACB9YE58_PLABR|nr:fam-m protein [Plasmodium brasilianum]